VISDAELLLGMYLEQQLAECRPEVIESELSQCARKPVKVAPEEAQLSPLPKPSLFVSPLTQQTTTEPSSRPAPCPAATENPYEARPVRRATSKPIPVPPVSVDKDHGDKTFLKPAASVPTGFASTADAAFSDASPKSAVRLQSSAPVHVETRAAAACPRALPPTVSHISRGRFASNTHPPPSDDPPPQHQHRHSSSEAVGGSRDGAGAQAKFGDPEAGAQSPYAQSSKPSPVHAPLLPSIGRAEPRQRDTSPSSGASLGVDFDKNNCTNNKSRHGASVASSPLGPRKQFLAPPTHRAPPASSWLDLGKQMVGTVKHQLGSIKSAALDGVKRTFLHPSRSSSEPQPALARPVTAADEASQARLSRVVSASDIHHTAVDLAPPLPRSRLGQDSSANSESVSGVRTRQHKHVPMTRSLEQQRAEGRREEVRRRRRCSADDAEACWDSAEARQVELPGCAPHAIQHDASQEVQVQVEQMTVEATRDEIASEKGLPRMGCDEQAGCNSPLCVHDMPPPYVCQADPKSEVTERYEKMFPGIKQAGASSRHMSGSSVGSCSSNRQASIAYITFAREPWTVGF